VKRHVVVVDDLAPVRALLRAALAADDRFSVVGEAADGTTALRIVDELGPDAVVLDLAMPRTDGLATLDRMIANHPDVVVVVYSELLQQRDAALAAGARAFVSKTAPIADLVEAVELALGPHPLARFDNRGFQRTVLDALDEGFVVQDSFGEIVYANPAAERILGVRAPDLVGLRSKDPRWDAVHEDGSPFEEPDHPIVAARLAGTPVRGVVMGIRRPSGERRWMQVSASPLFDLPGEAAIGAVATFTDITEQRRAIEALHASEEQTHRFLEALPVGVAVVEQGRMVFINDIGREILGTGPLDTLAGADIVEHFHLRRESTGEPYPFDELPIVRALFEGETSSADDVVVARPDGEIPVESYAAPVAGVEGDRQYAVAAFTDVSDRRAQDARLARALASLEAANEALMEFAAVAAHDLAAPLRTVSGFAELLEEQYGTLLPDEARNWVGSMLGETERMREFIDELLAYARAGAPTSTAAETRLNDVARKALDALAPEIERSAASIELGGLPVVIGDDGRLQQVLQNLLSNSLKFRASDRPPIVRVDAEAAGSVWTVTVTDNGVGVPEAEWSRIFAPFSRGASGDEQPGHGLGLTICRRIVERHGGRIWVESAADGGSRFCFTLPRVL
jgi:PAS domain S-box-containing protein